MGATTWGAREEETAALPGLRRFTCREVHDMERAGILDEDQRVELLGGQLFVMTIHPPHAAAVSQLDRRFQRALGDRVQVVVQSPLRLSDDLDDLNLPQPDLMLVAGADRVYADHPRPADVHLLIEVSDTTLDRDRLVKLPLYAAHAIPEAWIVNLAERRIEVHAEPRGGEFLTRATEPLTGRFAPRRFPSVRRQWLPEALLGLLG